MSYFLHGMRVTAYYLLHKIGVNFCELRDGPTKSYSVILSAIVIEEGTLSLAQFTDKSSKMFLPLIGLPIYYIYLNFVYFGRSHSHVFYMELSSKTTQN